MPQLEVSESKLYRTLVADPPWKFGDKLPGPKRGAVKHYNVLTVQEIMRFPLPRLAGDCRLFMWRVASMQREALMVIDAWGFKLKAEIVWVKRTVKGKRFFGMGRTVRAEHETCLIAVRGKPEILSRSIRSTFEASVGTHSTKPDAFKTIVDSLSPGPTAELFARTEWPGWDCFGEEL